LQKTAHFSFEIAKNRSKRVNFCKKSFETVRKRFENDPYFTFCLRKTPKKSPFRAAIPDLPNIQYTIDNMQFWSIYPLAHLVGIHNRPYPKYTSPAHTLFRPDSLAPHPPLALLGVVYLDELFQKTLHISSAGGYDIWALP
jgi:hypothetical protein